MNDSPSDWAEWSPDTPQAIADRLDEIRSTVSSLDSASPSEMNEFFYLHGFNELDLAVRDLLRIVAALQRQHPLDQPAHSQHR